MNNLDKLFEKKLAEHAITPSADLWERLETNLSKKNKPVYWMRWAAVFLLGILSLGAWWLKTQETKPALVKENIQTPVVKELKPEPVVVQIKAADKPERKLKKFTPPQDHTRAEDPSSIEIEKGNTEPHLVTENQNTTTSETKPVETVRPMVIVYTLDPVSTPGSEHATEESTVADKKDNSLKRVMKLAQEMKNSEAPLGGFRDMKEELFAFDLKRKSTSKKH